MLNNLIIFGAGLILGAAIMLALILLLFIIENRPKKLPTKEEWKVM